MKLEESVKYIMTGGSDHPDAYGIPSMEMRHRALYLFMEMYLEFPDIDSPYIHCSSGDIHFEFISEAGRLLISIPESLYDQIEWLVVKKKNNGNISMKAVYSNKIEKNLLDWINQNPYEGRKKN